MRPLRLYWDAYGLDAPGSGVFIHARHLALELRAQGISPLLVAEDKAAAFFPEFERLRPSPAVLGTRYGRLKPVWVRRATQAILRAEQDRPAMSSDTYIVHGLSNFNIPTGRCERAMRRVITVHDLIPLLAPESVSSAIAWQFRWLMPKVLAAADRVVCVSQWTKRTIAERFPFAVDKCEVIPNGVTASTDALAELASAAIERQSSDNAFLQLLYVARFERYKNHEQLLDLVRATRLRLHLTLVTDQRGAAHCRRSAADLVDAGRLTILTYLTPAQLAHFYRQADVYISPSQYEGFCLPAVEALAQGTPVVYRSGSGIDEVAGSVVGYPVAGAAGRSKWEEAILAAAAARQSPGYAAQLATYLGSLATWKQVASALAGVYGKLV